LLINYPVPLIIIRLKRILLLFLFSISFLTGKATHIVGGELYYTYLGNNQYRIQLTVYRDCFNGVPPFDDPALVGIWDANNVLLNSLNMTPNDSATIPPIINSPCFVPPTNVCYRVCNYFTTVTLAPRPGGYQLAYQRCCRNQTILNIVTPLDVGGTFYCTIPGTPSQNSNPQFNQLPPPFICSGLDFVFDHSATDAEGDSLVYELCNPYDGASTLDPALTTGTIVNYSPPYTTVTYQPPFNLGNLLGGTALTIDGQTGLLTATPNTIGQFVIGVCVNEYRNGIFLSKTRRDYQLNVVACPTLVVAALQTPLLTCGSNLVQFSNNSFGASTYLWNFGDPTTTTDVSTALNPSYNYPGVGTYTVTLIAYSSFNPGCADTTIGTVTIAPDYITDFSYSQTTCSPLVQFNDTSNAASGVTTQWNWNFGDGSPAVNIEDPTHNFPGPGTYTVTLQTVSALGCRETIVKTVIIPPYVSVSATSGTVTCTGLCTGQSTANTTSGISPFSFIWSNSQTTQTITNLCPGTYTVTVTDSLGCTSTATSTIGQPPVLTATASATDAYCDGLCIGTANATPAGGTSPYQIQWNDPNSQTGNPATGLCPGFYSATITDSNGCSVTTTPVEVEFDSFIPPLDAVISDSVIFAGQSVTLLANASGNFTYSWTPVLGLSSATVQSPIASPTQNTTYYVVITDPLGCSNTDSVSVAVKEVTCGEPVIYIPNAFTPNNDNSNDVVLVRGNTIRDLEFKIYDRWGEKVFETNDPKKGWDGYYQGKLASPAVYVYYVEAVCFDEQRFFKKGNVTLIR
jgi:gliding motility-associated-like protein